ncbi:DUF971 domain-containing protein [Chloroflexi bacterium TSY]|nr:DUF971 domain-containing protein [Chloroflexi bacterium TSY]
MSLETRPADITIAREKGEMIIKWSDGIEGVYPLRWLRANCPCATCREARRQAAAATDMLMLNSNLPAEPSTEISGAELVGNYAIRLEWNDGHGSGIYGFALLRASMELEKMNPNGSPILNFAYPPEE